MICMNISCVCIQYCFGQLVNKAIVISFSMSLKTFTLIQRSKSPHEHTMIADRIVKSVLAAVISMYILKG